MRLYYPAIAASVSVVVAVQAQSSSGSDNSVSWCSNTTATAVLTTCGSTCDSYQPCVQYSTASDCSEASRNTCETHSSTCTYQCLSAFNAVSSKWTLFVKEPTSTDSFVGGDNPTDEFPSAPVDRVVGVPFSEELRRIQITGFDSADVQKGSFKTVSFADNVFQSAAVLETLVVTNIDLSTLPTGFLSSSLTDLYLENCNMAAIPADLGTLTNLNELHLTKNNIADIPTDDASVSVLQQLTTLDLSANALTSFDLILPSITSLNLGDNDITTFPSAIFNMTSLTSLTLDGNSITNVVLTESQFTFLKRLSSNSTLGIVSTTGSCGEGQTENQVLSAVVCISSGELSSTEDDSGGSNSTILIVCIVVAVVVVFGGVGFFFYWRKRKSGGYYLSSNTPNTAQPTITPVSRERRTGSLGRPSSQYTGPQSMQHKPSIFASLQSGTAGGTYSGISRFPEDQSRDSLASSQPNDRRRQVNIINGNVQRIASDELNYTRTIAKGAFGEVWLASLGKDLVAVKKLITVEASNVDDFIAELNLLASLSHPRILGLIGACWDDNFTDLQIVTEYMDSGDLLTVLRKRSPADFTWDGGKGVYCLQICEAVYYLHSLQPALIHRDIKSRNILIDSQKGAKLSDFGESRQRTYHQTMTAGVGTARWVAPEIILGDNYSELADIYSLGVLLTELDTHLIPYQNIGLDEAMIVQQVAVGKLRPKVSDTCPEVIRRLAHECLQFDPMLRPSAARVLQTLMSSNIGRKSSMTLVNE